MKKGFGKPEIEMKTNDVHFNLEIETKEQVDWCIDQLKVLRRELPRESKRRL